MVFDTGTEHPDFWVNGVFPGAKNQYFQQTASGFVAQDYLPNNQVNTFNHTSAMADVNGDGAIDYLGTQFGGPSNAGFGLTLGYNVSGQFVDKSYLLPTDIRYRLTLDYEAYVHVDAQQVGAVAAAEMNSDGLTDIITVSYGPDLKTGKLSVRLLNQNTDGTFGEKTIAYIPTELEDANFSGGASISAGDIDGDGLNDLAIMWEGTGGTGVQLLRNLGNNDFTDVTTSVLGGYQIRNSTPDTDGHFAALITEVEFMDFNADGLVDLIFGQQGSVPGQYTTVANQAFGDNVYINDGAGHLVGWTPNVSANQFINMVGAADHPWASGTPVTMDVNNDKLMDVVFIDGRDGSTLTINTVLSADSASINMVIGTSANNKLTGTSGNDGLNGGAGVDKLTGGSGADSFIFDNIATGGADKIMDFKLSDGDVFAFDADVFTSIASGVTAENVVFSAKPKAVEEDDYLLFSTKGKLYYDADGSGSGSAVLIAGVKGSFSGIDYQDFQLM